MLLDQCKDKIVMVKRKLHQLHQFSIVLSCQYGTFFNHLFFLSLAMIRTYAARLFSVGSRPLARRIWSQRLRSSNMIIYLCRILRPLRYLTPAIKPHYQYLVSRFQNPSFWLYLLFNINCMFADRK